MQKQGNADSSSPVTKNISSRTLWRSRVCRRTRQLEGPDQGGNSGQGAGENRVTGSEKTERTANDNSASPHRRVGRSRRDDQERRGQRNHGQSASAQLRKCSRVAAERLAPNMEWPTGMAGAAIPADTIFDWAVLLLSRREVRRRRSTQVLAPLESASSQLRTIGLVQNFRPVFQGTARLQSSVSIFQF